MEEEADVVEEEEEEEERTDFQKNEGGSRVWKLWNSHFGSWDNFSLKQLCNVLIIHLRLSIQEFYPAYQSCKRSLFGRSRSKK